MMLHTPQRTLQAAVLTVFVSVGWSFQPTQRLTFLGQTTGSRVPSPHSSQSLLSPLRRLNTGTLHTERLQDVVWKSSKDDSVGGDEGDETLAAPAEGPAAASTTAAEPADQRSLAALISDMGQSFKPLAERATAKGYQAGRAPEKIWYAAQSCLYYLLFIVYRAYRGFFILLPEVFRQVYRRMEAAMNSDNLSLDGAGGGAGVGTADGGNERPASWRTKLTVSVLASVVTASYVLGGTLKTAERFLRTVTKTRSVPKSFEAAADEIVSYEGRISLIGKINGDETADTGGMAPF